jgi:phosphotransferase system  glucose/maltose/N-acetylglucosamine-specific IIC component
VGVLAADVVAVVIMIVLTALVVVAVLGLHVWGAIQDGREEKAMRAWRRRRRS